jgi:ribosomal protein S6--L-glutamate ligase
LLKDIDGIIPRIGPSVTSLGATLIGQFVNQGAVSLLSADSLLQARDKFRSLQILDRKGVPVPITILLSGTLGLEAAIESLGGFPIVLKLHGATHGEGVMLLDNMGQLRPAVEAFEHLKQQVMLQQFIREASGEDIRALVIGGEVVAAMRRQARPDDFRANLHQGGTGQSVSLTKKEQKLAVRAARTLGLEVAGVDFLRSEQGPLFLEVNASPGLEGIEQVSRVDVSGKIIRRLESLVREKKIRHADRT